MKKALLKKYAFNPHIVYLANSSALKVGITRFRSNANTLARSGATQALPIMKVGSRRLSGQLEVMFGTQVADKTDWRKLLKGEAEKVNLLEIRDELLTEFEPQIETIRDEFSMSLDFNENVEILETNFLVNSFILSINILKKLNRIT